MFTGIIEEKGTISKIMKNASQAVLTIKAQKIMEDIHKGDSIAVNGICLTVTAFSKNEFQADVMHETLNRTALKMLKAGRFFRRFFPAIVFYLLKRHDAFFKDAPAFFIIFKHIPACAGRT